MAGDIGANLRKLVLAEHDGHGQPLVLDIFIYISIDESLTSCVVALTIMTILKIFGINDNKLFFFTASCQVKLIGNFSISLALYWNSTFYV